VALLVPEVAMQQQPLHARGVGAHDEDGRHESRVDHTRRQIRPSVHEVRQ